MSTQILNFKKVEIVAESKEAAVENMEQLEELLLKIT